MDLARSLRDASKSGMIFFTFLLILILVLGLPRPGRNPTNELLPRPSSSPAVAKPSWRDVDVDVWIWMHRRPALLILFGGGRIWLIVAGGASARLMLKLQF